MKKTAVILFNLGGPSGPETVKSFLFNLFHDPAIIRLPQPLRFLVAKLISSRRAPIARAIYARMGGGSPILKNTQEQAEALHKKLNKDGPSQSFKTFVSMRYAFPFAADTLQYVKEFAPDNIVLLPLYPQFSTTTTASSLKEWQRVTEKADLHIPTKTICCYPQQGGFIRALAKTIRVTYQMAQHYGTPRVLFSAHGLPESIVKAGDPYAWQCEQTVAALMRELAIESLDSVLCYQSRVGPMKWIGPATDEEIKRAGNDRVPVVIVPIAFVSEHSETLVEIDIEYRHLATEVGVPFYGYVPTVSIMPDFIEGLAELVQGALQNTKACLSASGARLCPQEFSGCPYNGES